MRGPSFLSFIDGGTNKKPFKCDRHFHPVSGLNELPPSKRREEEEPAVHPRRPPAVSALREWYVHFYQQTAKPAAHEVVPLTTFSLRGSSKCYVLYCNMNTRMPSNAPGPVGGFTILLKMNVAISCRQNLAMT